MADLFYTDLARAKLEKAASELQGAQDYIIRAKIQGDFERVQKIINAVRREIDIIGSKAFYEAKA